MIHPEEPELETLQPGNSLVRAEGSAGRESRTRPRPAPQPLPPARRSPAAGGGAASSARNRKKAGAKAALAEVRAVSPSLAQVSPAAAPMLTEALAEEEGAGRGRLEPAAPLLPALRSVKRSVGQWGPRATPADRRCPPPPFPPLPAFYYGAATCRGEVGPGGTGGAAAGAPTPPEPGTRGAGRRGVGGRLESRSRGCAKEQPAPPPSSPPAGSANSGFCRAALAPSSAAENRSGGGSPPGSPGKSGGGSQGSPGVLGEAARPSLPDLSATRRSGPRPVGSAPASRFSPQSAQTTAR